MELFLSRCGWSRSIGLWCLTECVFGIESNEYPIPRFLGKYGYHTHHSENPTETQFSQRSPYVSVTLGCGILHFYESQCFSGNLGRAVGLK